MINYNYLFDLTPISKDEQLICSDYLEDRNEEILANCLRFDYKICNYSNSGEGRGLGDIRLNGFYYHDPLLANEYQESYELSGYGLGYGYSKRSNYTIYNEYYGIGCGYGDGVVPNFHKNHGDSFIIDWYLDIIYEL